MVTDAILSEWRASRLRFWAALVFLAIDPVLRFSDGTEISKSVTPTGFQI